MPWMRGTRARSRTTCKLGDHVVHHQVRGAGDARLTAGPGDSELAARTGRVGASGECHTLPRRYTMLHLGAMGMESLLAPEFFNITLEK